MRETISATIITIIWCALWAVMAYSIYMIYRCWKVYDYRMEVLAKVSKAARQDALADREFAWRYEMFDSITFEQMMKQFWVPLDEFWLDKSFMRAQK